VLACNASLLISFFGNIFFSRHAGGTKRPTCLVGRLLFYRRIALVRLQLKFSLPSSPRSLRLPYAAFRKTQRKTRHHLAVSRLCRERYSLAPSLAA
jgi:hypothetical protein